MIANTFYFVAATALLLWTALLWVAGLFGRPRAATVLILGAVSVGAAVFPLGDFTLWRWCLSVHANPSVLLVGFLTAYVGSRLTGTIWLTERDRQVAYLLGAIAGTVLYGSATGFLASDLYASAWEGRAVVVVVGLLAVALIATGNRTGILLAAALAAQVAGLLESHNTWDYVIDPVFWILSLYGLVHLGARRLWALLRTACSRAA